MRAATPGSMGALTALTALTVFAAADAAATELVSQGPMRLGVTGYVQQATGVSHLPWARDVPVEGLVPDNSSFHGGTLRVRWALDLGASVRLTVHDRLLWQIAAPTAMSGASGGGNRGAAGLIGVGSSAAPARSVDLTTTLVDGDGFLLSHDLDRVQISVETSLADLKIGRQAITWGFASVIPVADVWVQQSPFDLDRIEKRGVDAIRALMYPREDVEVDVVLADRGSWADLSGGLRVGYGGDSLEAYVAGAKQWRDLWAAAGVTWLSGAWKLRAEATLPWSLDTNSRGGMRATAGVDHLGSTWTWSAELSWNGPGARTSAGYLTGFSSLPLRRGVAYVVGQVYGALLASWQVVDGWTLSATALANLRDPSALVAGTVQWRLGQSASLVGSVYGGLGSSPDFQDLTAPSLRSEFGMVGVVGILQVVVYF